MGGSKGIEPIPRVPQTLVLPLHQQPHKNYGQGFAPCMALLRNRCCGKCLTHPIKRLPIPPPQL